MFSVLFHFFFTVYYLYGHCLVFFILSMIVLWGLSGVFGVFIVTPSLSLKHGVRLVPWPSSSVEQVLLAVGEVVGHENISYASRMHKALVVFLKNQVCVTDLIQNGVNVDNEFIQVLPLALLSTRIVVSGVPPFIPNEALETELWRYGKFTSGFKSVGLGCEDEKLKHVQSLQSIYVPRVTKPKSGGFL